MNQYRAQQKIDQIMARRKPLRLLLHGRARSESDASAVRHETWWGAALVGLLTLLFFAPLVIGDTFSTVAGHQTAVYPWRAYPSAYRDFPQSDQADLNYPWQTFIGHALAQGEFPFWNPHSFWGEPFFANGSSAVLYPPRLATAAFLSPSVAHDVLSVLHVLLAGLFMFLLLKE